MKRRNKKSRWERILNWMNTPSLALLTLAAFLWLADTAVKEQNRKVLEEHGFIEESASRYSSEPDAKPVFLTRAESEPNDNTAICQRIVDKHLVAAVIYKESSGHAHAIGDGGKAIGFMQLHAPAASECGVIDRRDPKQNVQCGAEYLMKLCKQFGTEERTLWAYNFGQGNVRRGATIPESTKRYAKTISRMAAVNRKLYAAAEFEVAGR